MPPTRRYQTTALMLVFLIVFEAISFFSIFSQPSTASAAAPGEIKRQPGRDLENGDSLPFELGGPDVIDPPTSEVGAVSDVQPGSTVKHRVARGEWLIQIARCYGAHYKDVLHANPGLAGAFLRVGMRVKVPGVGEVGPVLGPPCVFFEKVGRGDTWAPWRTSTARR